MYNCAYHKLSPSSLRSSLTLRTRLDSFAEKQDTTRSTEIELASYAYLVYNNLTICLTLRSIIYIIMIMRYFFVNFKIYATYACVQHCIADQVTPPIIIYITFRMDERPRSRWTSREWGRRRRIRKTVEVAGPVFLPLVGDMGRGPQVHPLLKEKETKVTNQLLEATTDTCPLVVP